MGTVKTDEFHEDDVRIAEQWPFAASRFLAPRIGTFPFDRHRTDIRKADLVTRHPGDSARDLSCATSGMASLDAAPMALIGICPARPSALRSPLSNRTGPTVDAAAIAGAVTG